MLVCSCVRLPASTFKSCLHLCRSRILDNGTEPYQDYGGEWRIQGTLPTTPAANFHDQLHAARSLACEVCRPESVRNELLSNAGAHAAATGDHGTSHLSVVDSHRNAVSFTTTINTSFGSKLFSQSTGIPS